MYALIKALVLPPAVNLFLALIGFILLARKRYRFGVTLIFLSVFSLYLLSISPISSLLLSGLETFRPLPRQVTSGDEQAIVVLGGGRYSNAPEYSTDTVNAWTLERLRYGAMLKKQTGLPILVSGGKLDKDILSEAEIMSVVLVESFNENADWLENKSRNTLENAIYSAEILRTAGIKRIYLVTHAFHMPRAVFAFDKVGLQVTPAPTVYEKYDPGTSTFMGFVPATTRLGRSTIALHEYLGLLWYRLRY